MALLDSFPGASSAVDSTELRKNLAGLIVRDTAGNPRAGIFPRHTNALVTSRADMKLDVAAFEGVSVRGGGPLFTANDGVAQSPALPIPVANSHICVLYFKQNESVAPYADADNLPIFGVVTGAASGTPAKPSIAGIAGATELATITVPSTATATNSGGVVITQSFDYTTAAGGLLLMRTAALRDAFTTATLGQRVYVIATLADFVWNGTAWVLPYPAQPTRGVASLTTDASGLAYITHGLGAVPANVQITAVDMGATISSVFMSTIAALTSTQIQVVAYRNDTKVRLAGTAVTVHWVAWP